MVGLSVVLEARNCSSFVNTKTPQVINKATLMVNRPSSSTSPFPAFLEHCFLCHQKLSPGKDIYMYKGDRGFCSVECRCRQIIVDEEELLMKDNCPLAAMKPASSSSTARSSSPAASPHRRENRRNRAGGRIEREL